MWGILLAGTSPFLYGDQVLLMMTRSIQLTLRSVLWFVPFSEEKQKEEFSAQAFLQILEASLFPEKGSPQEGLGGSLQRFPSQQLP